MVRKEPRNGGPVGGKVAHARKPTPAATGDGPVKTGRELKIPDGHTPGAGKPSRGGLDLPSNDLPAAGLTQTQLGQNVRKPLTGGLGVGLEPAPGLQHRRLAGAVPGEGVSKPGADCEDLLSAARRHLEVAMGLKVNPNGRGRYAQECQSRAVRQAEAWSCLTEVRPPTRGAHKRLLAQLCAANPFDEDPQRDVGR